MDPQLVSPTTSLCGFRRFRIHPVAFRQQPQLSPPSAYPIHDTAERSWPAALSGRRYDFGLCWLGDHKTACRDVARRVCLAMRFHFVGKVEPYPVTAELDGWQWRSSISAESSLGGAKLCVADIGHFPS